MQTSFFGTAQTGAAQTTDGIAAATGTGSEASKLFTTLLVAQIRNQNPLEPTDPSQFVNQLTQLSQVESLQALAAQSAASASIIDSMQVIALGAQVGSNVTVRSDRVVLEGEPVDAILTLAKASAQTELVLTGADGVQHRVALGSRKAGETPLRIDPAALGLAPGVYSIAAATDGGEAASLEVAGRLDGVKLSSDGSVVLQVSHLGEVAPESITRFNGRSDAATN